MATTLTRKLALLAGRVMIAAGLATGASIGMAAIAAADTHNSVADHNSVDRDPSRMRITTMRGQQYPTGLNGNLPQRPVTVLHDQFKHLPFNPAMPGGDK